MLAQQVAGAVRSLGRKKRTERDTERTAVVDQPLKRESWPPGLVPEIDVATLRRSHRILSPIVKQYFRCEVQGLESLPKDQTIIVTHHDGGVLPINGICLGVHWYDHFGFDRPLYVLTHDILHSIAEPFSKLLARLGLMRADRHAMDAALSQGKSVLVFPGAARESFRPFHRRHEIDLGGRMGFVAQAVRWKVPITPVVSAGAHETVFVLSGGHDLARKLGIPKLVRSGDVLPLLAGLPWGIWALPFLPQLPLPAKIKTSIMEPIDVAALLGKTLRPSDADDKVILQRGYELILAKMQQRLRELYAERKWPVIG